jgi:hypothetical protein
MAIDLKSETIIDLKRQAGAYLGVGRNGRPPHHSFLIRAVTRGINGQKLEALRVGSRWITSVEALQRWADRQTAGALPTPGVGGSTPARRRAAAERAERELDRLGF